METLRNMGPVEIRRSPDKTPPEERPEVNLTPLHFMMNSFFWPKFGIKRCKINTNQMFREYFTA